MASSATAFAKQAEKLSLQRNDSPQQEVTSTTAIEARFITPQDPVIETASGDRLPTVPLKEASKLNELRGQVEEQGSSSSIWERPTAQSGARQSSKADARLEQAIPPQRTHPLFPDLPLYGPPSFVRDLQCYGFRISSYILSLSFLMVIVLGSAFTSIPMMFRHIWIRLHGKDPDSRRPFYEEEKRMKQKRKKEARAWKEHKRRKSSATSLPTMDGETSIAQQRYPPLEGGPDPLVCDVRYYARRVGLECEDFSVQTEDGFIISLLHLYDPRETHSANTPTREYHSPVVFPKGFSATSTRSSESSTRSGQTKKRYPVLLIHGLLQSAGAYCCNDESSLAFTLHRSGYDVWLGQNRCGFKPRHTLLKPSDPRMWNWNIRQMGVLDLSALISRVLTETKCPRLGLVAHSQGTTETFVALAKGQRPDLGKKISVFCALAPAVYAGPLIGKMYFKFMRIISPSMFRLMFGIHAFIPFMMTMHRFLPGRLYGAMGYRVFSFLFQWSDTRWDLGLRDRFFQFSPVYVSAESMRWWLGRECFASQKCVLATRSEKEKEEEEDEEEDMAEQQIHERREARAWYDEQVPPFALWVAGADQLVDGHRLLRRFEKGREPHVKVLHQKVIDEYEHLDVLWAMDAPEKVGREVIEVIWGSLKEEERAIFRNVQYDGGLEDV